MRGNLAQSVHVARRFTRSIRVDSDLSDPEALEGYICSRSAADALGLMAQHRAATGHTAFTWTGPYGSGKSSLAVALGAVLTGDRRTVQQVLRSVPKEDAARLSTAFRPTSKRWLAVPVVGERCDPADKLEEAVERAVGRRANTRRQAKERLVPWIARLAAEIAEEGLVLVVDEMGKFLEHAALSNGDVHLFQELAEAAVRSKGRLIVVGILHQAFDEYANRLSREARDEWLKVQGRFVDIPLTLAADEQIELISRAIEAKGNAPVNGSATLVATTMRGSRAGPIAPLAERLAACWPLHPVVAALLGPISRRRFGQSQRSIFGFLTSAEPFGFQDFLTTARSPSVYEPDRLWDYLRANLDAAILASPDGHRWSIAVEAVERCECKGGGREHLRVLKCIALLDLFKDRSSLQPTPDLVAACVGDLDPDGLAQVIDALDTWSVIVFRKHAGAYAIYAGSDFDIERAVEEALATGVAVDYRQLARQAALQPVLAKRHYEATGALRWFEIELAPLHEAEDRAKAYRPAAGAAGLFLVLVSGNGEPQSEARKVCRRISEAAGQVLVIPGWTRDSYRLREMATELAALEHVRVARPELEGDPVARREVDARIARLSADLEDRLSEAIDVVDWALPQGAQISTTSQLTGPAALSVIASRLVDWRYPSTPLLRNELVNRTKPSSNAAAATRALLRAMVERSDEYRLGMEGYPPEVGLYASLLEATGLHQKHVDGTFGFEPPSPGDPYRLYPMWDAGRLLLLRSSAGCSLADLFALWKAPPLGVRDGLLPIFATAFLLTHSADVAVYLEGVFKPQIDAFLVDRLLQEPSAVGVRFVDLSEGTTSLVATLAKHLGDENTCVAPSALAVARALVRRVKNLPSWTMRTASLSPHAVTLRTLCSHSNDPNRLLFEDLPAAIGRTAENEAEELSQAILTGLDELESAYEGMLSDLSATLLRELRWKGTDSNYATLHGRAANVRGLTGNFRLDALATRLSSYEGTIEDIEGIASLAANKPARDWVDRDVDAAKVELAALAQQFLRAEGLGHLKGRQDGRLTFVVYMSDPAFPAPMAPEIELDDAEREQATSLASMLETLLSQQGAPAHIALGALAKLGASMAATRLDGQKVEA